MSGIGAINLPSGDLAGSLAAPTEPSSGLDGEEATEFMQLLSGLLAPQAPLVAQQTKLSWNAEADSPQIPFETQPLAGTIDQAEGLQSSVPNLGLGQSLFNLESFDLEEATPVDLTNAASILSSTEFDAPDLAIAPVLESTPSSDGEMDSLSVVAKPIVDGLESPVIADASRQRFAQVLDETSVEVDVDADFDSPNHEHVELPVQGEQQVNPVPATTLPTSTFSPTSEVAQVTETVQTIHEHLVREIVQRVEFRQDQEQQQFKMRLDPPELGEMLIKIRRYQGNVAVQLHAVQPTTASLIQPSLESLQELLKKHDLFDGGDVAISLFDSENRHDAVQHNVMQSSPHNAVSFRA